MDRAIFNVVYNRKKRLLSDGTALVQIEAYMYGKKKYFSTSIYLTPDQWDNKHRKVKNHPNAIKLNKQIATYRDKMESIELDRRNAGKPFSLVILAEMLQGKETHSFTDFMAKEIEASNDAPSTKIMKRTTLAALRDFRADILFDEVDYNLLSNFETFLKDRGLSDNTRRKYFCHIKAYVNLAINKDLFELNRYPFRKFKAKAVQPERCYLTPDEVSSIENLIVSGDNAHLQKVIDMFLFSCYTGLRFSDVSALTVDDIEHVESVNGQAPETWLRMTMQKTKEPLRLPLHAMFEGRPVEILARYTQPGKSRIFRGLTNQYVNRSLKEIAQLCGITKPITFHTARHTNATYLLYQGVNVTTVQKILGHKKLQTTQIYSKVMDMTVVKELSAIKYR